MARHSNTGTLENAADVNVDVEDVEVVEETVTPDTEVAAAAPKAPARPPIPEGFVTPIGFAKALSEKLGKEIRPQVIYSYIRNASKEHPLKTYSEGGRENLMKLEESLTWWMDKDVRVAAKKANAADKVAKSEAKAAEKAANPGTPSTSASENVDTASVEVVEAE